MVQILPLGPVSSNQHHWSLEEIRSWLSQDHSFCSLSSYWVSLQWDPGWKKRTKTFPWPPLVYKPHLEPAKPWMKTALLGTALDFRERQWWAETKCKFMSCPGSVNRRWGGVDVESIPCSCWWGCPPSRTETGRLQKGLPFAHGLTHQHADTLWPACLEATLPDATASSPQSNTHRTFS